MKQTPLIPNDPSEWTLADWRDLYDTFKKISERHTPQSQPPCDNAHVAPGCEPFGPDIVGELKRDIDRQNSRNAERVRLIWERIDEQIRRLDNYQTTLLDCRKAFVEIGEMLKAL